MNNILAVETEQLSP